MAKLKFDVVVVAVHYTAEGNIDWVRAFERRGPIFSGRMMIKRQALAEQIKSGKRVVVGQRVDQMGGTFTTGEAVRLVPANSGEVFVTGTSQAGRDHLEGVPIV